MPKKILLVDDEIDILDTMRVILEEFYEVQTAKSGSDALALLENEPVDLIVSDQRMPQMTGVELLTHVWKLYPDIVRIILTGYTILRHCGQASPLAYIEVEVVVSGKGVPDELLRFEVR